MKSDIATVCLEAVSMASEIILSGLNQKLSIDRKSDQSLATQIDMASEKAIIERIRRSFPSHTIIGEETGETTGMIHSGYRWVIDPLDGTHNYIRGIDLFGVSVGVIRDNEFIVGAVAIPTEQAIYFAEKGSGAFCNDRRITVSGTTSISSSTVSFDSSIHKNPDKISNSIRLIADKVFNIRMFGSSVRNLTYLSDGRLDACIEFNDFPWDFTGSIPILIEAGGRVTEISGDPFTPMSRNYIASNGLIHDELVEAIHNRKSNERFDNGSN